MKRERRLQPPRVKTDQLRQCLVVPGSWPCEVLLAAVLLLGAGSHQSSADVFTNVAEATNDGYELIYTLPIPDSASFSSTSVIPFLVDNSASFANTPFDRVAYYLELAGGQGLTYAYTSMDAFSTNLSDIGLPADGQLFQQNVSNLNVFSNSTSLTTGIGISTGNIEFWNTNYGTANSAGVPGANDGTYDFGDSVSGNGSYSSFQVHNHGAGETIIAYNQWAGFNPNADSDLGIGNRPVGNPDWTFSQSAGSYSVKNLQVLIRPSGLSVDSSLQRAIFQRNYQNSATIPLQGQVDASAAVSIEARAVPRAGYSGVATGWVTVDSSLQSGSWDGALDLLAGWYDIEVRSIDGGGNVVDQQSVNRVGVGEVFVVAGQSNSANYGNPTLSAQDDRVSAFDLTNWQKANDPMPVADGSGGSPWPALGDMLTEEWDVPVGFVSVGWGGTSAAQWEPGATGPDAEPLYNRLQDALTALGPDGARAVLWHQGEADNAFNTSAVAYEASLETIIAQSRVDAGYDVPWGIALASFISLGNPNDPNITAAQQKVVDDDPLNFLGAATDDLGGPAWRWDGIHFNEPGLREHAQRWFDQLLASLEFPTPTPGDYDGDGDTDIADLMRWQRNDGSAAGLDAWRTGAGAGGTSTQSASAVPEPLSIWGIVGAALCLAHDRRRR